MNSMPTLATVRTKLDRDGALFAADEMRVVLAALAQAEREREDEIVKLRADVVWIAQQRDENEQWARDRAAVAIQMADERDAARTEVERLKEEKEAEWRQFLALTRNEQIAELERRWKSAEADLARVRAALEGRE